MIPVETLCAKLLHKSRQPSITSRALDDELKVSQTLVEFQNKLIDLLLISEVLLREFKKTEDDGK